jgi:L-threonylcarbamoyladenylate synthase
VSDLMQAVERLRAGDVVGMPTETVYGLAADATNAAAVARVFALKGRLSTNPLIVHVESVEVAERYAVFNDAARSLFARFSPGPLTIVLPVRRGRQLPLPLPLGEGGGEGLKRTRELSAPPLHGPHSDPVPEGEGTSISRLVTAGLETVGIRIPDHPVALELLRAFDGALAAPSANKSNRTSPTTAAHVRAEFGQELLVLDGGPCRVGIESTVLDLSREVPMIVRPER